MSKPRQRDLERLKRLLRYYRGRPRATIQMRRGGDLQQCDVLVDADFAGCPYTRRSTCGGALMWGGSLIKPWSRTLLTIALSSGESELGALTKGAAEGLGLAALLRDFDCEIKLRIKSDATAAIGIASRQGLGRLRHVAVADLWVQQRMRAGDFTVDRNTAGLMTKTLDAPRIR